jgi:hypothetical protein
MDGHRRAALALHGLPPADRAWMLEQLAPAQRQPLARLLDELRELGIPAEPIEIALPLDAASRLRRAPARAVRRLLAGEPDGVVAAVLAIEPWPWSGAVLARLPRVRRRAIAARLQRRRDASPAPRLDQALLDELDQRLTRQRARPNPVRDWLQRMRKRWTKR